MAPENEVSPRAVHFLHIGKTGGTALKHVLSSVVPRAPWLHLHHHPTRLCDVPEGELVFFFLRDPVERFVSGFYSRQRKGQPRYNSRWSAAEAAAFERFTTANALALALSSCDDEQREAAQAAMRSIQHVKDSYWFWLKSEDYLYQRQADILLIGQQEHLEHDVRVLARVLDLPLPSLPIDPLQAHKNPAQVDKRLEPQAIRNLQAWYANDYAALAACRALALRAGLPGSLAKAV